MISVEAITPRNAMVFKETRLRALQDAPSAFSSNYAKEAQLSDADWVERAAQWSGERSVAYLALDKAIACGIAGAFIDQDDAAQAHLVSMWVAPGHRRLGVGATLVNAIVEWARTQSVGGLELLVMSNLSDCEMIRTIG
jgi:GNAT superfamily N-acetyltransferase